jgi:hypothetical protein
MMNRNALKHLGKLVRWGLLATLAIPLLLARFS